MQVISPSHLQSVWGLVRATGAMELETMILTSVGFLLGPFIFYAMWSLTLSFVYQLILLGVKAAFVTLALSLLFSYACHWKIVTDVLGGKQQTFEEGDKKRCSVADVFLSVVYQLGVRIPSPVWDLIMTLIGIDTEQLVQIRDEHSRGVAELKELLKTSERNNVAQEAGDGDCGGQDIGYEFVDSHDFPMIDLQDDVLAKEEGEGALGPAPARRYNTRKQKQKTTLCYPDLDSMSMNDVVSPLTPTPIRNRRTHRPSGSVKKPKF